MSALVAYLQQERTRRNWSVLELAERAELPDTTVTRILSGEVAEVKASQIARFAKALDEPFWKLMQIAGHTTETPGDLDQEERRIAVMIAADAELKLAMERASQLTPENRAVLLKQIAFLLQQQRDPPPTQESG